MTPGGSARDIGWYVHVPFCRHACPYCDFYKMELRDRPARERLDYPERLAEEAALLLEAHSELSDRPIATVYFGGGTPSVLSPPAVGKLVERLKAGNAGAEVTLEANPENLTSPRCEAWRAAGITRLSIGVQSFAEEELKRLERLHQPETIDRAVANARAAGFDNISLDLMFALPGQTIEGWRRNLRRAIALEPNHISFYGLTVHERTPFFDMQRAGNLPLPDEDAQAEMYLEGAAFLEGHGFEHYEISNFARPGFRSRHNQRYWRAEDVVGLGPGAHSNLGELRWSNPEDLDAWKAALAAGCLPRTRPETLPAEIAVEEQIFRGLRRKEGLDLTRRGAAARRLEAWLETPAGQQSAAQGWIAYTSDRIALSRQGWLRSDSLLLSILTNSAARQET